MKVNVQEHLQIAEEERRNMWVEIEKHVVDTLGYWKAVAKRKYLDGIITGLKINDAENDGLINLIKELELEAELKADKESNEG
jgi:hypothetical protein